MKYFLQKLKTLFNEKTSPITISLAITIFWLVPIFRVHASFLSYISQTLGGSALEVINKLLIYVIGFSAWVFERAADVLALAITAGFSPFSNQLMVNAIWVIFRDIANVFFIFILLVIAIATILRLESYGIKRLLPTLIIVALFINFSLLVTQYIILPSNWLAQDLFNAITNNGQTGLSQQLAGSFYVQTAVNNAQSGTAAGIGGAAGSAIAGAAIATVFFPGVGTIAGGAIGLVSYTIVNAIFGPSAEELFKSQVLAFSMAVSMITINFVAAFALLAGAILVTARTVFLLFLSVVSPLAFLAHAVPGAQGYARQWWSNLIKQSLFLPVYMLFIYMAIQISVNVTAAIKSATAKAGPKNILENPQILYFYALSVVMFIAAIFFAKSMGAHGAGLAIKYGQKGYRMAGGYAGRVALRTTVARPARALTESRIAQTMASQFPRTLGKAYQLAEKGAKAGGLGKSEADQVALLKSLPDAMRAQTFANLSRRAQDQALDQLSARDIASMKAQAAPGSREDAAIQAAATRMPIAKREQLEEESAKVAMRNATDVSDLVEQFRRLTAGGQNVMVQSEKDLVKTLDRLAPTVAGLANVLMTLPNELQGAYLRGTSKEQIQHLAQEYERRGQGRDFVDAVAARAPEHERDATSVLPAYAVRPAPGAPPPTSDQYRDTVSRLDLEKTSASHIVGNNELMKAIVHYSGPKQIQEIVKRNDEVTKKYFDEITTAWFMFGKDIDKMSDFFASKGNTAMATMVKRNQELQRTMGLT